MSAFCALINALLYLSLGCLPQGLGVSGKVVFEKSLQLFNLSLDPNLFKYVCYFLFAAISGLEGPLNSCVNGTIICCHGAQFVRLNVINAACKINNIPQCD